MPTVKTCGGAAAGGPATAFFAGVHPLPEGCDSGAIKLRVSVEADERFVLSSP